MNGQRCTAGSRLLIEHTLYARFIGAVAERAKAMRVGSPFAPETELGPLIRAEHLERVEAYIASAIEQGARLLAGGRRPARLDAGNFLEATVLGDVEPDLAAFQEEIFGPVLVATPFRDEAHAVELANCTPYGLAGYVWSGDGQRALRVAHALDVGMCWVNAHNVRDLRTPFGGVKASGLGREGGQDAFEFYCDVETVQVALGTHSVPRFGVPNQPANSGSEQA
jgi:5-carboxymethyl-2-hydroxymuconic-semialdehyde dehydrogenase